MDDITFEEFTQCLLRDMRKDNDPELADAASKAFAACEWYARLGISPPEKRWEVPA